MPLFLCLAIIIMTYVSTFKDDFTQEHIDKAMPFIIAVCVIILLFGFLVTWIGG